MELLTLIGVDDPGMSKCYVLVTFEIVSSLLS
jgi:hypothetical protein